MPRHKPVVLLLAFLVVCSAENPYRPVVLMHGLQASAEAMSHAEGWIKADFPGIYVLNVEIGNGKKDSLSMNINRQVDVFAAVVRNDTHLANGFDLIGHSQGGLITRAYVERYNDPPVHNLVSWAGPQDGVFGVPDFNSFCPDHDCPWINWLFDTLMNSGASKEIQGALTFAAYWKDVLRYDSYLRENIFLADINNERDTKNATYRQHIQSLNSYLLIYSTTDKIVVPRTSPWFSFFERGEDKKVVPLNSTLQYKEDWIGLRTLDERGSLLFAAVPCGHQDIPRAVCKEYYTKYTKPLLGK